MKRIHGITMDKQTYTCKTLNHFTYYSILHWRNGLNINFKKPRCLKCTTAREMYLFKFTLYIIYNKITNLTKNHIQCSPETKKQRQLWLQFYTCTFIISFNFLFYKQQKGKKFRFLQRSYRVFLCYVKQVDLIRTGYLLTRYSPVQFS